MLRVPLLALLLLPLWAAAQAPAPRLNMPDGVTPGISNVRFQHGDDPRWSQPEFDDASWAPGSLRALPSYDGIYWLRFRVDLPPDCDAVTIAVVASYDLYWDGKLIGRSGKVGTSRATEEPGPVDNVLRIPTDPATGPHVVALRLSSFYTGFSSPTYSVVFRVARLRELLTFKARTTAAMMIGTGGALLVGLVFLLLWLLAERRADVGWFALACVGTGIERGLQAWRWVETYPYNWHHPRLVAITAVVAVLGVVRVAFLLSFFQLRRGWIWILALLVMMAALWPISPLYNLKALALGCGALGLSIAITLIACRQRRRGASVILIALAITAIALASDPRDFLEQSFVYNSGAVMLGYVIALSLQLRDQRRAARASQLAAARLELELLKKNIQPHFLLNTLATIMEVIEDDPKTAVALIEALAGEFRILARVSGEQLISLEQELDLCRAHLRVMSLRKGAHCTLAVAPDVDGRLLVPPALFHTLVENGLTHLLPRNGEQRFGLSVQLSGALARLAFTAEGIPAEPPPPQREPGAAGTPTATAEGTGLRYIRARLNESFSDRWSLDGGPVPEGWRTVIEIEARLGPAVQTAPDGSATRMVAASTQLLA